MPKSQDSERGNNLSPLAMAAGKNQLDIVKILLDAGENINQQYEFGHTILHWAVCFNQKNLIHLLLNNKQKLTIDINIKNDTGNTPADIAIKYQRHDIFKWLKEHGSIVTIPDENPRSNSLGYSQNLSQTLTKAEMEAFLGKSIAEIISSGDKKHYNHSASLTKTFLPSKAIPSLTIVVIFRACISAS